MSNSNEQKSQRKHVVFDLPTVGMTANIPLPLYVHNRISDEFVPLSISSFFASTQSDFRTSVSLETLFDTTDGPSTWKYFLVFFYIRFVWLCRTQHGYPSGIQTPGSPFLPKGRHNQRWILDCRWESHKRGQQRMLHSGSIVLVFHLCSWTWTTSCPSLN